MGALLLALLEAGFEIGRIERHPDIQGHLLLTLSKGEYTGLLGVPPELSATAITEMLPMLHQQIEQAAKSISYC